MSKNLLINTNDMSIFEPRRYYQEYEGTFITATNKSEDDTLDTSRYIEVTEIWGNTVQDENNLEDIQSIGELYVNEDEEPILDDLGREQYKVEIESINKNLCDESNSDKTKRRFEYYDIKIIPNCKYTISYKDALSTTGGIAVISYNSSMQKIEEKLITYNDKATYTAPIGSSYMTVIIDTWWTDGILSNKPNIKVMIEKDTTSYLYTPHKSNKTTILLPCQLQKVGDVYDRLYWDSEKGKYVVEKNIEETILDGNIRDTTTSNGHNLYKMIVDKLRANDETIIIQGLKSVTRDAIENYSVYTFTSWSWFWFKLDDSEIDKTRASNFIEGRKCIFTTSIPQLIETNITKKILLPCYEEKTHIFVNSTIDATMKVLVPYKEII